VNYPFKLWPSKLWLTISPSDYNQNFFSVFLQCYTIRVLCKIHIQNLQAVNIFQQSKTKNETKIHKLKYIVQSSEAQFRCMSFSMSRRIYCCE